MFASAAAASSQGLLSPGISRARSIGANNKKQLQATSPASRRRSRSQVVPSAAYTDTPAASAPSSPSSATSSKSHDTDVVVIGAGIGGLCAGALLAKYGLKVTVVEAHDIPGGAAHAWKRDGYTFESGPSLFSGMSKWQGLTTAFH